MGAIAANKASKSVLLKRRRPSTDIRNRSSHELSNGSPSSFQQSRIDDDDDRDHRAHTSIVGDNERCESYNHARQHKSCVSLPKGRCWPRPVGNSILGYPVITRANLYRSMSRRRWNISLCGGHEPTWRLRGLYHPCNWQVYAPYRS